MLSIKLALSREADEQGEFCYTLGFTACSVCLYEVKVTPVFPKSGHDLCVYDVICFQADFIFNFSRGIQVEK